MKTALLVTGAFGGLGKALVEHALHLKDVECVIATDIDNEVLNYYKQNPKVHALVMDVGSRQSIIHVREEIQKLGISIKYIINNAGISRFFPVSEATEKELDGILKVNTYGPVLTVSSFIRDLIDNKGRIVQISSDSVRLSGLFQPYASSKIALESLSVAMRQELSIHNVKLILIRPGAIKTNLLHDIGQAKLASEESVYKKEFAKFREIAQKEVGKIVAPEKVAKLAMKAIMARKPKLVYSINKNAKISFLVKFPQRWIDYLIKKTILSK